MTVHESQNMNLSRVWSLLSMSPNQVLKSLWVRVKCNSSPSRRLESPSLPSTELDPSTSKHWSDQTPQREHSIISADRLVSSSTGALKGQSVKSRLFSVLVTQWWNEHTTNVRTAESLAIFHKRLKNHYFRVHLDPALHDSLNLVLFQFKNALCSSNYLLSLTISHTMPVLGITAWE